VNGHQTALALAATAVDFALTAEERATLHGHLAACDSCTHAARALHSDAAAIASLPVPRLDRRRAEALLAGVVDAPSPGRPAFRLLAVAAVLTLLALGSLAVGAEMLRRAEQTDLSVVPPIPLPSVVADAPPMTATGIGLSWTPVTMPGWTVPDPGGSTMNGVIAGGPGAIAWGWAYGLAAQIWTTADGIDWQPATIEFPGDADPESKEPGAITSIRAWGSGYVASGFYSRLETGRRTLVWTSPDGRTWTLVPHDPVLEIGIMDNLVAWRGELLAFGHAPAGAMGGGAGAQLWSSPEGITWTAETLRLPDGLTMGFAVATGDRLWAYGATGGVDTAGDGESVILTSTDGRTWARSPLPRSNRQLAAPSGDLLGLLRPGFDGVDGPGIYRTADLETWQVLSGEAAAVGYDVIDVGGLLVMVGDDAATGDCGTGCHATGWWSTDSGRTWQAVPVDGPSGTMHHVAALPNGTLVAVGDRIVDGDFPSPAAWVSVPVTTPAATPEPSPVPTASAAPIVRSWASIGSIPVDPMSFRDVVGFDGGYVAVQWDRKAWFSPDGVSWEAVTLPFKETTTKKGVHLGASVQAAASDGPSVLVVGGAEDKTCTAAPSSDTGGGPLCPIIPLSWVSSDGRTWTGGTPVTGLTPPANMKQGAEFVAAWPVPGGGWDAAVSWWEGESLTGRDLLHSEDGLTWSPIAPAPVPATAKASDLPWHHEGVADASGRRLLWMDWTGEWPPTTAVAMSDDGTAWAAVDGFPGDAADITDAIAPAPDGPWLLAGQLVAGEEGQGVPAVWVSTDGRAWTVVSLPVGGQGSGRVERLLRESDGYLAVGYRLDGTDASWLTAWHSTDGLAWALVDASSDGALADGNHFAAIGPAGTIAVVAWMASQEPGSDVLRLR
jgi:hypothetical protein